LLKQERTIHAPQAADIQVNQIVNPLVGVRVTFPRALLPSNSMFSRKK
jgi:hypothetical protein